MRQDHTSSEDGAANPPFDVRIERGSEVVVMVRGEIDLATAGRFSAVLDEALAGSSRLIVDLSETTFLDSTGLSALVAAHRQLGQDPGAIVLRSPNPVVRRALTVSGVADLVTIEESAGEL